MPVTSARTGTDMSGSPSRSHEASHQARGRVTASWGTPRMPTTFSTSWTPMDSAAQRSAAPRARARKGGVRTVRHSRW